MLIEERIKDGINSNNSLKVINFTFPVEIPNRKKPHIYAAEIHMDAEKLDVGIYIKSMQIYVKGRVKQ